MSLAPNGDSLIASGGDDVAPLGDIDTEPARLGGLTAFGPAVVTECNRPGIVVDLARPVTRR